MITTEIKLAGLGALLAISIGLILWVPAHYKNEGRQEAFKEYQEASRIALNKRNAENEALKLKHEEINTKVVSDYEQKLSDQKTSYDKRINDLKRNGGLRVPESTCREFAGAPTTESATRDNEASGYRLPERIESGLFDLARKADEVKIQLGACQAWIRDNGMSN